MDAAAAAAMSDPERNPHFRRRWDEGSPDAPTASPRTSTEGIGTLGLALQEALDRRLRAEQALAVATNTGDPPK